LQEQVEVEENLVLVEQDSFKETQVVQVVELWVMVQLRQEVLETLLR
jgi:hypothetical protein